MSANILMKRLPRSAAESTQRMLKVGGITPFTATDYPGQIAAVVFVQGCPWRCGYCHNPHLQPRLADSPLDWTRIRNLLQRRVGLVDAVVFSGGEPTIDPHLADAIGEVKEMGFKVGLHSGGIYQNRFNEILPMLDRCWTGSVSTSRRPSIIAMTALRALPTVQSPRSRVRRQSFQGMSIMNSARRFIPIC
jgi:pyruvate formate lyase activating enzyme